MRSKDLKSLADVHDLLGLRIITYFPDEVDAVAEIVEREFDVDEPHSVDKRRLLDPDRFGYLSLHYIVMLDARRVGLPENERFADDRFEIQIRSILQHTWAEIEHDLGYQSESAIPAELRRRFSRIAGLLEVADAEFRTIRDEITAYQASVSEQLREGDPGEVRIDRESMRAYVAEDDLVLKLDTSISQLENGMLETVAEGSSFYARELQAVGFTTVGDVKAALEASKGAVLDFAREWFRQPDGYGLGEAGIPFARGTSLFFLCYVTLARTGSIEAIEDFLRTNLITGDPGETERDVANQILETWEAANAG